MMKGADPHRVDVLFCIRPSFEVFECLEPRFAVIGFQLGQRVVVQRLPRGAAIPTLPLNHQDLDTVRVRLAKMS